ncbi:hypothetical protein WL99_26230 [Burkholderia cepacia]|uniref:hypothetical protein n=1 Tax=Burkholderia cepacia TaxID=292 RepID=UPI00075CF4B3|nr:hypothetical protein [Burkholderia cepacia]KWH23387.1 hypothetical protein WL99_26230 [Burkholderia cepacia]
MTTKRQRPSPDQWAKLDAALEGMRERTPPGVAPPLAQEILRRADTLRAALKSGWRIRDLAVFFKDVAGIDVSPSTIQTALRQALINAQPDTKRPRAKRPRKHRTIATPQVPQVAMAASCSQGGLWPAADQPIATSEAKADVPRSPAITQLGSTLTLGATKRGQR